MFWIRRATLRRRTLSSLFAVLSIFFLLGTGYAKDRVPRNLLILHSYHPSLSWTDAVMKGMQEVLVQSGEPVQLHVDYLDARRYSGAEYRQKTEALLLHKLTKERFDLVLLSDNDALDFYLENCKRIAPGVPVIFCGINNFNPAALSGYGKITGIAEEVSLQETIDTALKLHLGTKEIIVIGRTSLPADRANREAFRSLVQSGPQSVKFIFWDDLSAKELRRRLPSLESGSLVFINGLTQEETGRQLLYDETTRLIREASKVPLYSLWDVYLGYGIVGGKLVSGYMQGKLAGELAVRVLRGEDPDKMPVIRKEGANRFMFDYRELTRFGLSVSSVPAGSEIVNSPSSFYVVNKGYIWGGVVSLLIFAVIILLLGINIFARRRAEGALRESETKYRLLHETMTDAFARVDMAGRIQEANHVYQSMLGYSDEELRRLTYIDLTPEKWHALEASIIEEQVLGQGHSRVYEKEYRKKDGMIFPVELRTFLLRDDLGQTVGMWAIVRDITERKRAEQSLRESEERMRLFFERQLVGMAITSPEKGWLQVNDKLCEMLGYSREELAHLTWAELTQPEDLAADVAQFERVLGGEIDKYSLEKRFIRKDGKVVYADLSVGCVRRPDGSVNYVLAVLADITERKRVQESLQKSEREYRSVIENIQDVFYRSDINGRFIMGSPSGVKMFGYDSLEEMIGLPLESLWADPKERAPALAKMKESGSVRDLEAVLKRKDGTIFNALFDTHFYYDDQGNLLGTEGMIRDITERKRAEEALRDSENRYRRLVELSPEMIAVHLNERYIYVNPVGLKLLGVAKPEELIGRSILDIIHPDYWEVIKERNWEIQQEGKEVPLIEEKYLCPDGRILDVEVAAAPFEYQGQSAVIAVVRDITERKRVEAAFKEKTAELDRFFSLALDLLCIANTEGYFQRLNRAWENVLGYRTEDLEGKKFLDLVHPGDLPATLEAVAELSRGKEVINFTNRYRCRDGSYRWIEWRSVPYQNKLIYAAARDITERKRVEDALKETEERYRALFDGSPDCVYIHDFNGNFIAANSAALRLFGYERDEILSLNFSALAKPDQLSKAFKTFSELRQTGTQKQITDLTLMRKDGCYVDVEAVGSVIVHEGKPYAIQGVARDITERKKAEEALRKSEEEAKRLAQETTIMAEIGRIISSTLHIEEVYERFVAEVRKLIPFDRISINVKEPGEDRFKVVYTSGLDVPSRRAGNTVPFAETFTGEVIRTRSSLIVNPEAMKEFVKRFPGYLLNYQAGLRAAIAVPLFSRDELVGVMTISSTAQIPYTEREIRLVERVGNQISGAIANAVIFSELKRVEEALRSSEERYRHVVELSPELIGVHSKGKYLYMNPAGVKLLGGKGPEELIGRSPFDFVHPDFSEIARDRVQRIYRERKEQPTIEEKFLRLDGKVVDVEVAVAPLNYQGERAGLVMARDITERKKGEEALRKSEEEAKRLAQETTTMAEIGKIISSTLNIEEVYERFVAEVRKLIPFDRISINAVDPGKRKVKVAYISGLAVGGRRSGDTVPLAETITGEVIRTHSCLVVNPESMKELIKRFPGYLPVYQAGLRSLIAVPLFSRNDVVGVMILSSIGSICYGERDLKLAEKVGNQISGAIGNALIFAELKRVEEELRMAQLALEARVQERTADLVKINKELHAEIIERKHTEELLKNAKEAAEASSIAKSTFLANMSHELRTPLNAIIGFSELIADEQAGGLNETQKEYTGDVLRSSRQLLSLINDILDLSEVEAGKLQLEVEEVFLAALLQNSFDMIKEKSMKHGIQLRMEIGGIPERIRGNERKLKQILYNLLSNAVKFTPDGGVVTLGACRLFSQDHQWTKGNGCWEFVPFVPSGSGEWVGISVRDTGIGLKKEDLTRIFDPFEQVDNSASRRYQGTGLGLALARKLVELHGGKIWAESEGPGKGSLFRFLIPLNS